MIVFNSYCFIIFSFFHFKLLNEKNDDEDETHAGVKRNELLQQLMKDQDEEKKLQEQQVCFSVANFVSILFSF